MKHLFFQPYCWWTKSCTTKDDNYSIIYRVLTIPGGAGFLPSTVAHLQKNPSPAELLKEYLFLELWPESWAEARWISARWKDVTTGCLSWRECFFPTLLPPPLPKKRVLIETGFTARFFLLLLLSFWRNTRIFVKCHFLESKGVSSSECSWR